MSKGRSELNSKHQSKISFSSVGIIGDSNGYEVFKEVVLRLKAKDVKPQNTVSIFGRIAVDNEWEEILSITGSGTYLVHVASWDYIKFECVTYDASTSKTPSLLASGFFGDGDFIANAINNANDDHNDRLDKVISALVGLNCKMENLVKHLEVITDIETEELS